MPTAQFRAWYIRTSWAHGPLSLLAGGVWDYYTLQLDRPFDNAVLFAYLLGFAGVTALDFRVDLGLPVPDLATRHRRWLQLAGQFALGGLLSAYFVHYLRGAPVERELLWLALLASIAALNELADYAARLPWLRVPLLAFVGFNYVLAVLPLATGDLVGPALPLLGASVLVLGTMGLAAWRAPEIRPVLQALAAGVAALAIQFGMVAADLVPPLPLTLMAAEVTSAAAEDQLYSLDSMAELLAPVGLLTPELAWAEGEIVRVRTPIYLPESMETTVVHRWARWDEGWVTTDHVPLDIRGGREGGFRTFSLKRRAAPGWWRVYVETPSGRELGRITFQLVDDG